MLTDVKARKAKPAEKPYRLTDTGRLFLWVTPAGGKIWRFRYEYQGKEKLLALGPYPAVGLAEAREKREEAKALRRAGRDPSLERKLARAVGQAAVVFAAHARDGDVNGAMVGALLFNRRFAGEA